MSEAPSGATIEYGRLAQNTLCLDGELEDAVLRPHRSDWARESLYSLALLALFGLGNGSFQVVGKVILASGPNIENMQVAMVMIYSQLPGSKALALSVVQYRYNLDLETILCFGAL